MIKYDFESFTVDSKELTYNATMYLSDIPEVLRNLADIPLTKEGIISIVGDVIYDDGMAYPSDRAIMILETNEPLRFSLSDFMDADQFTTQVYRRFDWDNYASRYDYSNEG